MVAGAEEYCYYPDPTGNPNGSPPSTTQCFDAYISWPTDSEWRPTGSSSENESGSDSGVTSPYQLVGNGNNPTTQCPGIYFARKTSTSYGDYLFFRVRVNHTGTTGSPADLAANTWTGTVWVYLRNSLSSPYLPMQTLAWDSKGTGATAPNTQHGLEFQTLKSGTDWGGSKGVQFDDVDGSDTLKYEKDIDGLPSNATPDFRNREGFVRAVSGTTCSGINQTFVDFAVRCAYFTRLRNLTGNAYPDYCSESTIYIQAGTLSNANDHQQIQNNNQGDVGRGVGTALGAPVAGDWDGAQPTAAVVSHITASFDGHQVIVGWTTGAEYGTAGYNLYRHDPQTGAQVRVNDDPIPALIESPAGGRYLVRDPEAAYGDLLRYTIEEITFDGTKHCYGPFDVSAADPSLSSVLDLSELDPVTGYGRVARTLSTQRKGPGKALSQSLSTRSDTPSGVTAASSARIKIGVRQSGLVKLEAKAVASALRLPLQTVRRLISTNGFELSNRGKPVAQTASKDGSALYFFAEKTESIYTDLNIYWLSTGRGTTMSSVKPPAAGQASGGETFKDKRHQEENHWSLPALFHDPEADIWVWDYLVAKSGQGAAKSFGLSAPGASGGKGKLRVNLMGMSSEGQDHDHHATISLNGNVLGVAVWKGAVPHTVTLPIDHGLAEENQVTVTAILDAGIPFSIFAVDSMDLTYDRYYRAESDHLLLRGDGNRSIKVSGFSSPDIWVFDITNPRYPKIVSNSKVGGADGSWWVTFRPQNPNTPYFAVSTGGLSSPEFLTTSSNDDLKRNLSAEYLVVTAPELQAAAADLAAYREARGLSTQVVTTDSIYDSFSWGIPSPHAIRDFIKHLVGKPKTNLRYVVFAGEGSYDYRNFQGFDDSLVPPLMADTPYGLVPSDVKMVDVAGDDGIPEVAFGRIPAVDSDELLTYLAKLSAYESNDGPWRDRVLFVADNQDQAGDFPADSDDVAELVPSWYRVDKIYMADSSDAGRARTDLLAALREGVFWFNYFGHSAYDYLAHERLLKSSDVPGLGNAERLPIMTAMTCFIGQFGFPGLDCLGESLVKQGDGGATAVFAPTGLALNAASKVLDTGLWEHVAHNGGTLGDAVRAAYQKLAESGGDRYAAESYTLLGDPAIEVGR